MSKIASRSVDLKKWLAATPFRWALLPLLATALLPFSGCKFGRPDPLAQASEAFYQGQWVESADILAKETSKDQRQAEDQIRLNLASSYAAKGDLTNSESLLRIVRNNQTKNRLSAGNLIAESAALVSDRTIIPYRWRDYESSYATSLLALLSAAGDQVDMFAYCHQLDKHSRQTANGGSNLKQKVNSETAGKEPPKSIDRDQVAFQQFLLGLLRSQDPLQHQLTVQHFQTAARFAPGNPAFQEAARTHSSRGPADQTGTVTVISFVNPGPRYVEEVEEVSTAALAIATELLKERSDDEITLPPLVAPVSIPAVGPAQRPIDSILVRSKSGEVSQSCSIWDVHKSAMNEYQRDRRWLVARAVAARAVKKAIVEQGKKKLAGDGDSSLGKVLDVAGFLWELSEKTDLRSWNFLPGEIHVNQIRLTPGEHRLTLQPVIAGGGSRGRTGSSREIRVRVRPQGNIVVLNMAASPEAMQPINGPITRQTDRR